MLTPIQKNDIDEYLREKVWVYIADHILTSKQKENSEKMRCIAFEMERILKQLAARFGIYGMDIKLK